MVYTATSFVALRKLTQKTYWNIMVFLFKHFEVALYTASSFQKLGSISTNWNCRLCVEPTSKLARNPPKQLNVTSNRNHVQHYYYRDVLFASIFYWEIAVFREQGHRKLGVFLVSGLFFKFTFFFVCASFLSIWMKASVLVQVQNGVLLLH